MLYSRVAFEEPKFRLALFRHPCSIASFSGIVFMIKCSLSLPILTVHGAPILNGNAGYLLTFVGTWTQILAYSLPLLAVFLPMIVPTPVCAKIAVLYCS
ncbi:MAG: hypothetical protein NWE93_00660 [Candidatus Bathyarchaeota archaeon]|nr:hypothetical protein [Candidatus Bathyarchaeota archaeon]